MPRALPRPQLTCMYGSSTLLTASLVGVVLLGLTRRKTARHSSADVVLAAVSRALKKHKSTPSWLSPLPISSLAH